MSSIDVVEVGRDDRYRFTRMAADYFGEEHDADLDKVPAVIDRAIVARDAGEEIGTAATIDFHLRMPGGGRLAMDGVTWVAVSPVARRRGALRAMMDEMLEHARARGIPLLGLGASESVIYRRFGYGIAAHIGSARIDTAHASLREGFTDTGHVRMQPLEGAPALWRDIEERDPRRVGTVNRSEASWRRSAAHGARASEGKGPVQVAVHVDASGVEDGFVNYRLEQRWPDEIADGTVHVREMAAHTLEAHLALWQHVLRMDLMEHLVAERYWADDPVKHLLADGRRLRVTLRDDLHLRVADVVATLSARAYGREDSLVIEVRDTAAPDIAGRYRLDGGLAGASVERTDAAAEIVFDAPSLGAVLLGDTSVGALHAAGIVEEARAGAVARAGAMFSWSPRPWLNYMF